MEELLEFKKNIISWYPIKENHKVLQIGKDEKIFEELSCKTKDIKVIEDINIDEKNIFDYITIIGFFEALNSESEILEVLEFAKKHLEKSGKILLAMPNKFGMKYWTGEKISIDSETFGTIVSKKENILSFNGIKNILNSLNLKYKFYYPLPDYKITNVIYTDEFMPNNDSIDARDLTYCNDGELLIFSEREAYKQLLEKDSNEFPFFANSYFIEISNNESFEDIKYVSFGITRKKEHRIKTVIGKENAYKTANCIEAKEHIKNISKNIEILNRSDIKCLDSFLDDVIISKYLKDAKSYDEVLMENYYSNGLNAVIDKIKEFKKNILDKLLDDTTNLENTVFEKYNVEISDELKQKLHFTHNGIIDLIFQNCLVKENEVFTYDQEWYEENVPIEFILYRAVFYFTELKKQEDIEKIYKLLELNEYIEYFEKLENILQNNIIDEKMWELHVNSTKNLGGSKNFIESYEAKLEAANTHIKNLEEITEKYKQGIDDLNKLIQEKDAGLVDYANQLRAISNSLSWKITKPIRQISSALSKKKSG